VTDRGEACFNMAVTRLPPSIMDLVVVRRKSDGIKLVCTRIALIQRQKRGQNWQF